MRKRTLVVTLIMVVVVTSGCVGAWALQQSPPPPSTPRPAAPAKNDTPPAAPVKTALTCIEALPLTVQIGQKLMFAGFSDQLANQRSIFQQAGIGGVILMDQTSQASISEFTNGFAITPTVAIDQEGGTVQRYKSEGILPGATDMTQFSPNDAYTRYLSDAQYLKRNGITVNFAPVVDVLSANPSPLPGRMYSTDPSVVTTYARQAIQAAKNVGITPVIKHFPGLGSATGNTDNGSATTDPLATLKSRDLIPYQQLASTQPDVMINNAIIPGLTNGQPAVWSPAAIALLYSYGYTNSVIYSDSLTANAIPGALNDAAVKAWQAGVDVALIVQERRETALLSGYIATIVASATTALESGTLDKRAFAQSVLKILERKQVDPCGVKI